MAAEGAEPAGRAEESSGTGRGPEWAEPEGTGSAKAGTSYWLRPEVPDRRPTDVSTSSCRGQI